MPRSRKQQGRRTPEAQDTVTVHKLDRPQRLDKVLRGLYPQAGRRAVESLVNAGQVTVNGRKVWLCSWQVKNGDRLALLAPLPSKPMPQTAFQDAWILARDGDLIAVDKPAGLLSHATRWSGAPNLLDLATERFGPLSLFHRLDRDTSGVVLLTRGGPLNAYLDAAFKSRLVVKEYVALAAAGSNLAQQGVIDAPIGPHGSRRDMMAVVRQGGKAALTRYQVVAREAGRVWLRLWPETGRTHQLRVHLAHLGAPILGDRLYGPPRPEVARLMLHAYRIGLPAQDAFAQRSFTAPLPGDFLGRARLVGVLD